MSSNHLYERDADEIELKIIDVFICKLRKKVDRLRQRKTTSSSAGLDALKVLREPGRGVRSAALSFRSSWNSRNRLGARSGAVLFVGAGLATSGAGKAGARLTARAKSKAPSPPPRGRTGRTPARPG